MALAFLAPGTRPTMSQYSIGKVSAANLGNSTGTFTCTTLSTGANNFVAASPTTAAYASNATFFDNGGANDGRIRFVGPGIGSTQYITVTGNISVSPGASNVNNASNIILVGIAKNGTVLQESVQAYSSSSDSAATGNFRIGCNVNAVCPVVPGDYFQIFIGNTTYANASWNIYTYTLRAETVVRV